VTGNPSLRKRGPDRKKPQLDAGRRAFLDRKREAARLASVPGWFAAAPGASQAPAFPGAPLPSFALRATEGKPAVAQCAKAGLVE